ncbi:unnamed protein product [Microthlaspi erraticum]|uniref:E2 ubiquitin-conjugating enzyme n=1 Tax=Microthlaspi erraticum TaxID=1685480 RepID=A0A6D2J8S4_9BRAS|nr:unnamed protein product [Microthlaspi erraticum]
MATPARKRLMWDFKRLQKDPPVGISGVPQDYNIMHWNALIFGPDDSPWDGGTFKLTIQFTEDYPNKLPVVRFVSRMFHPNIYADGSICLDILQNQWSPIYDVAAILTSIQSLLCDPNPNSPANSEAARLFSENKREYNRKVMEVVEQSYLNIAMKKNSMRKNKKLVVNIAQKKEALASKSVGADHDLGSSRDEDQSKIESSERRKYVFHKVYSIDEDEAIDDVRDGVMREVEVGTGLSGALKRLREQGTFKEKKGKLVVGGVTDNYGDDRFRDAFKDIRIERVDEHGRMLNAREAFRLLCHRFHGKKPGKRKVGKRNRKHQDQSKQMESSERAVEKMRQLHAGLKTPYIVLLSFPDS